MALGCLRLLNLNAPIGYICLAVGGYLLYGPAIAVRVAEEDESDVVQGARFGIWVLAENLGLADLHPRSTSWARAACRSETISCSPRSEPGTMSVSPFPSTIEQPEPGGVSWTM